MPLPSPNPTKLPSRLRLLLVLVVAAVLLPALVRLWCIKGLIQTIRIDGPSMAETLCGDHFRVICGDCGFVFRCDADHPPEDRLAVCPNCGFHENNLRDEDLRRGDRVLVDTWPYLWSAPQRGDVVMLRKPLEGESGGDGSFAVKRVAALPRERPGIRGGNLLANGDLVHKTLRELSDSAVLVHDNDFRPASVSSNQRWKPHSPETVGWTVKEKSLHFESTAGHDESQWMDYEHWHGTGSPAPRTEPAILQDNDSYNQADKRGLNLVHDIMVRCHVEGENGDIMLVLHDQPHQFLVHFQLNSRTFLVRRRNQTVFSGRLPEPARHFTLEAALCDGNLLVGYNQLPLTSIPYDENPESPSQPSASPLQPRLQIGAYGGPLDITHIQVWRDLYHLTPSGLSGEWQSAAPLGEDRYFLLGDNPPVSIDSRHWGSGIARDQIVGRVIPLSR